MAIKHTKKYSTLLVIREVQIKSAIWYQCNPPAGLKWMRQKYISSVASGRITKLSNTPLWEYKLVHALGNSVIGPPVTECAHILCPTSFTPWYTLQKFTFTKKCTQSAHAKEKHRNTLLTAEEINWGLSRWEAQWHRTGINIWVPVTLRVVQFEKNLSWHHTLWFSVRYTLRIYILKCNLALLGPSEIIFKGLHKPFSSHQVPYWTPLPIPASILPHFNWPPIYFIVPCLILLYPASYNLPTLPVSSQLGHRLPVFVTSPLSLSDKSLHFKLKHCFRRT